MPCALPSQFTLKSGQGVLQRLPYQPSLLVCDRIEGLDGLRRSAGIELHRPARPVNARGPARGGCSRLAARKPGSLGDGADEFGGNPSITMSQLQNYLERLS